MDLKRREPKSVEEFFEKEVEVGRVKSRVDPERLTSLRISSFPFCPVKWFCSLSTASAKTKEESYHSQFFTSIGTAIHEMVQNLISSNAKTVRDWVCTYCGTTYEFTTRPAECGKCKSVLFSSKEHQVRAGVIVGHIDDGVKLKQIRVLDYKSTTKSSLTVKGKLPHLGNVRQIESYAAIKKKQGEDIGGWDLIYIVRDNGARAYKNCEDFYKRSFEEEYPSIIKRIKKYVKDYKFVSTLKNRKQLIELADLRHRKKPDEDQGSCGHCSYSELCLNNKAILAHLNTTYDKVKKKLPIRKED